MAEFIRQFSTRVRYALSRAGIETEEQLRGTPLAELRRLPNIGALAVSEIADVLRLPRDMTDPLQILRDLYASEINASISWFWDGGLEVALGDQMNGVVAETRIIERDMWENAAEWLRAEAVKHYPNSEFAKRHV
jgi:hypothetical protein